DRADRNPWLAAQRANGVVRVLQQVFFFSSRRRHTRSDRDWSSDVCSSDLICAPLVHGARAFGALYLCTRDAEPPSQATVDFISRSEERRVGKECRARWSRWACKQRKKIRRVMTAAALPRGT